MATDLNKKLKAVNHDLKALAKKIDKMIVAIDKLEKSKVVKKKKPKKLQPLIPSTGLSKGP